MDERMRQMREITPGFDDLVASVMEPSLCPECRADMGEHLRSELERVLRDGGADDATCPRHAEART